jgi:hypothetical protein
MDRIPELVTRHMIFADRRMTVKQSRCSSFTALALPKNGRAERFGNPDVKDADR